MAAAATVLAGVVLFAVLARTWGIPTGPEGAILPAGISGPLQAGLLGVLALGAVAALRWPLAGGSLVAVAAVALGVFAAVEYRPAAALIACLAFLAPAVVLLVARPRGLRPRALAGVAAGLAVLLAAGGVAAAWVYDASFGPTHPESPLTALPVDRVEWAWAGAMTPTSLRVVARLAAGRERARLVAAPAAGGVPAVSAVRAAEGDPPVVALTVAGLRPAVAYRWWVEVDGTRDRTRGAGSVTTFPRGAASFTIAFSACARTGSSGAVYDAIRAERPAAYIAVGDFFYANIDENDVGRFADAYQATLTSPAQSALYRSVPVAYVWDDHDYGPNDADATSPSRPAAMAAYRRFVPHYPLAAAAPEAPIAQAFTIGRVRVILTDTRSARTPRAAPDTPEKTMLGAAQRDWLLRELARARDRWPVVLWVNPDPWIAPASAGADSWAGYSAERRIIAERIAALDIPGLVMLSGDAHMVALDDGTNSGYAAGGAGGFPVAHAAALDRRGSVKGGPYSVGAIGGSGQFATVEVFDAGGDEVRLVISGRDWRSRRLMELAVAVPAGRPDGARG